VDIGRLGTVTAADTRRTEIRETRFELGLGRVLDGTGRRMSSAGHPEVDA
jgi:hypothetical protein